VGPTPDAAGFADRILWLEDAVGTLGEWFEPSSARRLARKAGEQLTVEPSSVAHGYLTQALGRLGRHRTEEDLVSVLGTLAASDALRGDVLAELGRRGRRPVVPAHAAVAGAGVLGAAAPFADVWEFVTWAEANRPHWHLASRPAKPWGAE
jgi:hypothetical protein